MISKAFLESLYLFYRFMLKRLRNSYTTYGRTHKCPPPDKLSTQTIVCDVEGALLRNSSTFPYLMLVALEAGGFLRGLLLLSLYPLISCLSRELALRLMVFVCFLGVRKESFRMGRAVLPKFFLEDVGLEGFEVLRRGGRRVCVSSMPTAMVEGFLKEYLNVEVVLGRELKVFGGYYTGLMEETEVKAGLALEELLAGGRVTEDGIVGFGGYSSSLHQQLFTCCKVSHVSTHENHEKFCAFTASTFICLVSFEETSHTGFERLCFGWYVRSTSNGPWCSIDTCVCVYGKNQPCVRAC